MDGPVSVASLFCRHGNNNDNSNPHHHTHHRKRTHEQMSRDHARPALPRHQHTNFAGHSDSSTSSSFPDITNNLRIPIIHPHQRRSFDLRRPASMSSRPPRLIRDEEIIDLTNDNNNDDDQQPHSRRRDRHLDTFRSPVVQTSDRSAAHLPRTNHRHPSSVEQVFIDLSEDEEGNSRQQSPEIEFVRSRTRSRSMHGDDYRAPRQPFGARQHLVPWPTANIPQINSIGNHLQRLRDNVARAAWERFPMADNWRPQVPQILDFQTVGFDLANPQQQPPPPTYDAPPPPQAGFTRSTTDENAMLVCPNCDFELGTGDDDEQIQVWAVKACGHVYCGKCVHNRNPRRKKGSQSEGWIGKPFSKCVVKDCGKVMSDKRSLVQIYL